MGAFDFFAKLFMEVDLVFGDLINVACLAVEIEDKFQRGGYLLGFFVKDVASCSNDKVFSNETSSPAFQHFTEINEEESDAAEGVH